MSSTRSNPSTKENPNGTDKFAAAIVSLSIALRGGAAIAQAAMVNGEVKKIDKSA